MTPLLAPMVNYQCRGSSEQWTLMLLLHTYAPRLSDPARVRNAPRT